ncbi:protein phosphatase [Luteitalea sp. TBR-22]|uniref:PP2C family protein-serine/threonine phosphatase n=1 Tax=Luteitalea sp. TBR-22 TaxID=2802971 RepID=UPI001AF6BEC3|nr:PP2C family serine/threonine-protein phosphatase [Luteitalea sp. TBR-22]BCS34927.1 protein phosphatase [Luteitalea sp. TBR-22]
MSDSLHDAASPALPGLAFDAPVLVDAFGLSDVGHRRPTNEDHFLIARIGRYFETQSTSLPDGDMPARADEAGYALVVADGMGGHAAGEFASRLAIRELVRMALSLPDWIVRLDERTLDIAAQRSEDRIVKAHEAILAESRREPELSGMGSTVTAVRNLGRMLQIAHVGDSRAYLLRQGRLTRLTRDHTYVQMLVDCGAMTLEQAARSRTRHVLVNAVGGVNEDVRVDVQHVPLEDGDRLLLCSDGLSDLVDDEAIRHAMTEATTSEEACRTLVALALDAGGRDNVTAVVATYRFATSSPGA